MTASRVPSRSKIALVAVAGLMLSLGTTASYADNAEQLGIARQGAHVVVPHAPARALYPSYGQTGVDRQDQCVGGYRWIQQEIDSNRTPGENSVPIPCR